MINDFKPDDDDKKRELYVAMTRAKQNLAIHLNGNYLDHITCENIERNVDDYRYKPSNLLVVHLSHKDIWLDYFISKQGIISSLKSGDKLQVNTNGCCDENGNCILKFSNSYKEKIANYEKQGYKLTDGNVNYIVYWQKEETEKKYY